MAVESSIKDVIILLPSLSFQGTTKVVNKGVDVTLVTDSANIEVAMKASRTLVVRGISTVVLEVTCLSPIDERTMIHFIEATGALVFTNTDIYEATKHLFKVDTLFDVSDSLKEERLIQCVEKIVKKKIIRCQLEQ